MPFVSVIIPCYNSGEYIERALCALEKQTYTDFNVILIDDCSTDNTQEVILTFKKHSTIDVIYEKNMENSGPAFSRNHAIGMSKADYICFCDSDDWYDNNYLERMVEASDEGNVDMVLCGYKMVYSDGRNTSKPFLSSSYGELSVKDALRTDVDALWRLMVKREIAKNHPLPNLRNGEDMAVIPIWMLHSHRITAIRDAIYNYLQRSGSLSVAADMRVVNSLISSFAYIKEHKGNEYTEELEYIGIRNLVYGALLNLFKCGKDIRMAQQILQDFEKDFPNWNKNPYISDFPIFKYLYVKCAAKKLFGINIALSKIHQYLTK